MPSVPSFLATAHLGRSTPDPAHRAVETVVITGASSGIGRATALAYAARGAHLVLVARGRELLEETASACGDAGAASVTVAATDVCDADAMVQVLDRARDAHGEVDVVVHAAMVMAYGAIDALPLDVVDRVIDTATHGTVRVARAALSVFKAQDRGNLVIVTSLLSSVAVPGIGAYVTGKWAQAGLARVLQLETAAFDHIFVSTVAPGAVDTPIYQRAANVVGHPGKPPPPVDRPEKVAAAIVRAVDKNRKRVSVGPLNQMVVFGARFVTPLYDRLVGPLYRTFALDRADISPTEGNVFEGSGPTAGSAGSSSPQRGRGAAPNPTETP